MELQRVLFMLAIYGFRRIACAMNMQCKFITYVISICSRRLPRRHALQAWDASAAILLYETNGNFASDETCLFCANGMFANLVT